MFRRLALAALLLAGGVAPLQAQTFGGDLRRSTFDGVADPLDEAGYGPDDGVDATSDTLPRPVRRRPGAADETNAAATEIGSTGLTGGGRQDPVRPFSDRLATVDGIRSIGGRRGMAEDGIFEGDTLYDAAQGLRVGTFTIRPQMTLTTGWTDNAQGSAGGSGSYYTSLAPDVTVSSDWSRHRLDLALRGAYVVYPDSSADDDPSLSVSGALRLDLSDQTAVNTNAAWSYSREDASSAENPSGDGDVHGLNASVGVTQAAGLLGVTLRGDIERTVYTAAPATGRRGGRDNTVLSASLRLDGLTGAMLEPFVEGTVLHRSFDHTCSDALCERRDAVGYQAKVGTRILAGPKLAGEIGAGWRVERLDDARLRDLAGVVAEGSLVWSPSRLTTVTGGVGTAFNATDIDGASGSILYSADLRVAHAFSDRLTGEVGAGYSLRTYQGMALDERTATGLAGATYALTRNVALTASYTYRNFDSTVGGADYDENRIQAGVRIRH
ncbi:hypothetical protein SL003B_0844 [Polymorphum gilvum SL003B-26A1]|uniref:Outer membrane beta-barrel protein n=2 Tax=Polymorphum TaxID=991903 RepID=F2IWH5_POLGS|nr:hypothetical protein SL003B_0844 [Polymorphum gilvum SL003B-26A1]